jgi:UPF0755 protein
VSDERQRGYESEPDEELGPSGLFGADPDDDVAGDAGRGEEGDGGRERLDEATDHADDEVPRSRGGLVSCLAVLVILGLLAAGGFFAFSQGMERIKDLFADPEDYTGAGSERVVFEVREGESLTTIGRNLADVDVVASTEAFIEAADADASARGIQVGFYNLRKQMSAEAALEVLVDPSNIVQSTVTIPEGLRVEDTIALLAKETGKPLRRFQQALARPKAIGLPKYAGGNPEGYLFPATYAFRPDADATAMLASMVERWRQAAQKAQLVERADALGYSPAQLMIVASLVEAEANRDEDRGKVARVIYNRLETDATGGLLQIDATVNYALDRDLGLGLTPEQLQVDDPYNTRVYPGLPPGPIESPGDDAIAAAANPTPGDWIYYVTVNLDTGETRFTADYDQFLEWKNVELAEFCAGSKRC